MSLYECRIGSLRFDSSQELRIFSLSNVCDKTKEYLPLILFDENLSELGIQKSKVELRKWSGEGIILFSDIV